MRQKPVNHAVRERKIKISSFRNRNIPGSNVANFPTLGTARGIRDRLSKLPRSASPWSEKEINTLLFLGVKIFRPFSILIKVFLVRNLINGRQKLLVL